jgi:hypothetical protein
VNHLGVTTVIECKVVPCLIGGTATAVGRSRVLYGEKRKEKDKVSKDREGEWVLICGRQSGVSMADRKEGAMRQQKTKTPINGR